MCSAALPAVPWYYPPPAMNPLSSNFPRREGRRKIAMRVSKNATDQHGCRAVPGTGRVLANERGCPTRTACAVWCNGLRQRRLLCPTRLCVSPRSISGFDVCQWRNHLGRVASYCIKLVMEWEAWTMTTMMIEDEARGRFYLSLFLDVYVNIMMINVSVPWWPTHTSSLPATALTSAPRLSRVHLFIVPPFRPGVSCSWKSPMTKVDQSNSTEYG